MNTTAKATHTAGPWHTGDGVCMVFAPDATTVAILANRPETDANARLIAAAPEMLEALDAFLIGVYSDIHECLYCGYDGNQHNEVCRVGKAEAIIRKVRGEQ